MKAKISQKRHIAKTLTWRVIASITTFVLGWFFFRDDEQVFQKATGLVIAEFILKILFYYLHERAWYSFDFGVQHKRKEFGDDE